MCTLNLVLKSNHYALHTTARPRKWLIPGNPQQWLEKAGLKDRTEALSIRGIETRFYHSGEDPRWRIYHLTHIVSYNVDQKAVVTDVAATNKATIRLKELEQPQGLRKHTASWRSFSYRSREQCLRSVQKRAVLATAELHSGTL